MPRPFNERQALEKERAELPGRIAVYQRELADIATTMARWEFLDRQIRNAQNRLEHVGARLAAIEPEGAEGR
jgi:uncharacterized protein involved in exopolysaccharide biosynthesis